MWLLEKLKTPFLSKPQYDKHIEVPPEKIQRSMTDENDMLYAFFDSNNNYNILDAQELASLQAQKIDIYRQCAKIPDVSMGLTEIIDEVAFAADFKDILKITIDHKNKTLVKKIEEKFNRVIRLLQVDKNFYKFVRDTYIDGQMVVHLDYGKTGINSIVHLDPRYLVFDLEKNTYRYIDDSITASLVNPMTMNFRVKTFPKSLDGTTEFSPEEIVQQDFGMMTPEGVRLSYLEQTIKIANQLKTLEDLLIPLRMSRSVSRRVFNIDIGDMPNDKARAYMKEIMDEFKYKKFYNVETGEITDQQHLASLVEDYYFSARNGSRGTQVETLDETGNLGELGDILYFYRKLYKSMGIPTNRIYLDEASQQPLFDNDSTSTTNEDVKFFMFINRIRDSYCRFVLDILKRELIYSGVVKEKEYEQIRDSIEIYFPSKNQFLERMDLNNFLKKVDAINSCRDLAGTILPVKTLYKEIFKMEDNEIEDTMKEIREESKNSLYKQFYQDLGYEGDGDYNIGNHVPDNIGNDGDHVGDSNGDFDMPAPPENNTEKDSEEFTNG